MPSKPLPGTALRFKRRLLAWYRRTARDLPWRNTRDPYHVLVSEFMLQQTQVSRVESYYPAFLTRYPTVADLAAATPRAVRESWDGLGYYRRAANLHRLAQAVIKQYAGRIPDKPETLRTLPGVGRYTAGAVATFAFERREPAVDTNVQRVLDRVFSGGKRHLRAGRPKAGNGIWDLARSLLPKRGSVAWEFNQALMDLGATVCTARVMKCGECPVRVVCRTGKKMGGGNAGM